MSHNNVVEVGMHSYRDLSYAFSATIFGTNGGVPPPAITCGDSGSDTVGFFLDPFADHECAGSDWIVVLIMSMVIFAVTWWGRWFVWEPIAAMRMAGLKKKLDPSTISNTKRFGMTMTSILFHFTSAFFVFKILTKTEWLWSAREWSSNVQEGTIETDFKFYYLLYLARYCSDSVSMFFEERRKVRTAQYAYYDSEGFLTI
jgi:hypothetical protein